MRTAIRRIVLYISTLSLVCLVSGMTLFTQDIPASTSALKVDTNSQFKVDTNSQFKEDSVHSTAERPRVGDLSPWLPSRTNAIAHNQSAQSCALISPAGGTVSGGNGEVLSVPTGALTSPVNVCISTLTADQLVELVGPRPQGTQFLGGVTLDMGGITFVQPVTLNIPNSASISPDVQVLVAKAVDTGQLAGRGLSLLTEAQLSPDESQIIGAPEENFPGIRTEGAIVFEAIDTPLGYVGGTAVDVNDQPMSNAAVMAVPTAGEGGPALGYIGVTDGAGSFCLPLEAGGVSNQLVGLGDVGGAIIGGVSDAILAQFKQWLYKTLEIEEPEIEQTISYELHIYCYPDKILVGSAATCKAWGLQFAEYSFEDFSTPKFLLTSQDVTTDTTFSVRDADSSIAYFEGTGPGNNSLRAVNPGDIIASGWYALYGEGQTDVRCVCPPGQIECNNKCFTGNCCTDGDCPPGRVCINHTCQGWESKPLNVSPSAFLELGPAPPSVDLETKPTALASPLSSAVALYDILPMQGPAGTHPVTTTLTQNFINLTNAVEAYTVDFVDDQTSEYRAEVFALKTLDGPYSHDYSVCGRFHDFILDSVTFKAYPDLAPDSPWFWHCTMHQDTVVEKALLFTVLVDEDATPTQFRVDSRWLDDYYYPNPIYSPYDYMLNFQIWSRTSEDEAVELMRRTIENLRSHGNVSFFNTTEPVSPTVFIKTASYSDDTIYLTVQSSLAESRTVHFFGTKRPYTDTNTSLPLSFYETVQPGTSLIGLPVGDMIDAIVLSKVDDFLDKVYVGGGFWFHFSDDESEAFPVQMTCDSPTSFGGQDFALAGCYHITGTVALQHGYVGLGRVFNPNGQPVDVSEYQAVTFWAKGDGKSYRMNIETDSVDDYDYPQFVFTPPDGEWRQFVIPLSLFDQQGWGTPVPFTATDVKSVAWLSVGPHCDDAVELAIDRVAFFNSTLISNTRGPTSTNDVFGPYIISTKIEDDIGVVTATLHYSVNGDDFVGTALTGDGSTFIGKIPGQPMESEIRYYIEAMDADGNVATDPVDAPYTAHHFRMEWYPSLLVDDFGDRKPNNVLGGWSGIFKDPDEGGVITPCYDGNILNLTFDVTDHLPGVDEYAGYYSELEQADLTPYNSVALQVKGEDGGEKVRIGLNDGLGHEPKIELSEHLPSGITTDWQPVKIPLVAFTPIDNWSGMKSLTLVAEGSIGSGSGTIYLDNLNFEPHARSLPLDNFNDLDNQNGVGQLHDTDIGSGASLDVSYDQANPYSGAGASLALAYSVPNNSYAAWHSGLGGLDVSSYDNLAFAVRGAGGGETFHVWLKGGGVEKWVEVTDYVTITADWTQVEIPLQDFANKGVDLTQLSLFKVAFEWAPMNGTVYLDDIRFTLPPSPTITALSPISATNNVSTMLTLTGTNFLMDPTVALDHYPLKDVTLLNSTKLLAMIPPGIPPGIYDVQVIQPNMQSGVLNDAFTMGSVSSVYLPIILKK